MRHHAFYDFDAFAESIRDIDARMILVNPTRHFWTSSGVDLTGIDVQAGQLGSGNLGLAELRHDGYFFYLPTTLGVDYLANGQLLSYDSIAVIQPGSEFCISTKQPHDWNAVFIPSDIFEQQVVDPPSFFNGASCRLTRADRRVANRLRSMVREVMFAAANCPEFESSAAAEVAAIEMLKITTAALEQPAVDTGSDRGRPKVSREQIIRGCLAFLEEHSHEPVTVPDLARSVDVSERTLRTAFKDYFGIGPTRYLLMRQLHQVRRALCEANPFEDSVTRVMLSQGVWECGRFAARYRQQFGELPSQTLLRNKSPAKGNAATVNPNTS